MAKTCKYCLRPVHAKELCYLHYKRQQRGTDLAKEVRWLEQLLSRQCGLKKCHKPTFLQGLCFSHFHQVMEAGLPVPVVQDTTPDRCQLKHCRRRAKDNGFCQDHAEQLRQLQSDKDLFDAVIKDKQGAYERTTLTLDQVDFDDHTYRMRQVIEQPFVEDLARSIRKIGLLHPPILEAMPGGRYRLISGFCRCTALQLLSHSQPEYRQFEARIIDPDCFSHLELLKIAFEENDKRNYVNHLEKALKATQLKHRQALDNGEIAAVMDVSTRRVTELFKLVKDGHEKVLEALRDGRIEFYHVQHLLKLDKAEQPKWLQKVLDNGWSVDQLEAALHERQENRNEKVLHKLLNNEFDGIEVESSTQRGPYQLNVELEDRNLLRKFVHEFVARYYV